MSVVFIPSFPTGPRDKRSCLHGPSRWPIKILPHFSAFRKAWEPVRIAQRHPARSTLDSMKQLLNAGKRNVVVHWSSTSGRAGLFEQEPAPCSSALLLVFNPTSASADLLQATTYCKTGYVIEALSYNSRLHVVVHLL